MRPSLSTVTMRPSSTFSGRASARGSWTSTPPCSIGAVIMKMMSRTNATSTSEVTLMSAEIGTPPRRRPSPPPRPPTMLEQPLAGHRAHQFVGEPVHLPFEESEPRGEVVVADHRGARGREAGDGGDQRLGDARGDRGEVPRAAGGDPEEGRHHPEHRAEES